MAFNSKVKPGKTIGRIISFLKFKPRSKSNSKDLTLPTNFLSSSLSTKTAIYIGCDGLAGMDDFIRSNLDYYTDLLNELGFQFIYYPALLQRDQYAGNVARLISYCYPLLRGTEGLLIENIETIEPKVFYKSIIDTYNVENTEWPLILLTDGGHRYLEIILKTLYERFTPEGIEILKIKLKDLSFQARNSISHYNPTQGEDDGDKEELNDPEVAFTEEASKITQEVNQRIKQLFDQGSNLALLKIYEEIIFQTKSKNPELFQKFGQIQNAAIAIKQSRLVVQANGKIVLPEYNNLEIEMKPLPKALYILFLKYPQGIMLPDLVDHKSELLAIYERISNSSSNREIRKRIDDLTDIRNNSINEKCSRIKEAFVSVMDDSVACTYYITGRRGEPKKVALNPELLAIHLK